MMKTSLAFVIPLIKALTAAPVALEARAVSPGLLSNLQFFSQYAAASYCGGNNDSPNTKITCPVGNCPRVEAAATRTLTEFENTFSTDTTGFLAVDRTNRYIVLSFRGSSSVRNYLANLAFTTTPVELCAGCEVHDGFWSSWLEVQPTVIKAIQDARAANPGFPVVATGHSLGGAIATLAAARLRTLGIPAALYTYGAPRVGNDRLATFITNQAGGNFRVTHRDDPVPRLPPRFLGGYEHVSPEYWINSGNPPQVRTSDIEVLAGISNTNGNAGTSGLNRQAHQFYFGPISACEGDASEFFR